MKQQIADATAENVIDKLAVDLGMTKADAMEVNYIYAPATRPGTTLNGASMQASK